MDKTKQCGGNIKVTICLPGVAADRSGPGFPLILHRPYSQGRYPLPLTRVLQAKLTLVIFTVILQLPGFFFFIQLFNAIGNGQVFGHSAPNFLYGFSYFFANL